MDPNQDNQTPEAPDTAKMNEVGFFLFSFLPQFCTLR